MSGQTRAPSQQTATSQSRATEQTPIFRSGITLVTSDVIVRDANDLFIPDLTAEDFTVEEDGVEQEVVSLVLVQSGRVYNQLTPPAPVQEGIVLPARRTVNDTAGRIIILFVDDLHMEPSYTPKIRHLVKTIGEQLIHEGDLFGVISSGSSSLALDLTYDRSLLTAAANKIVGSGFSPRELINDLQESSQGSQELRWRAHVAFKTVHSVLENLEDVQNRRKVLVYLSSGYDLNPFEVQRLFGSNRAARFLEAENLPPPSYEEIPDAVENPIQRIERQGLVFADADLVAELSELAKAANRANTSFYTMDPRGLLSGPDIDYDVPIDAWGEYVFQTQSSLRMLADLTGGIAIVTRTTSTHCSSKSTRKAATTTCLASTPATPTRPTEHAS